jgi:hypothetical protein
VFRELIELLCLGKDHVFEWFAVKQIVQLASPKAINQRAVISSANKSATTDGREILFRANLHRRCEALETGMALILNRRAGREGPTMCFTAKGIAKADVFERRLKGVTD